MAATGACIIPGVVSIVNLETEKGEVLSDMSEITLNIDGMHCGSCVKRVTQTLEKVPGAEVVEVRIGAARLKTDDAAGAVAALAKAGYKAHQTA